MQIKGRLILSSTDVDQARSRGAFDLALQQ